MANKHDGVVAGESFPRPPKVNSLQALTRLRAKRGCEWCTFAFVLNRDMIKSDGSLDDLHAVVFPLGSFSDQDKAEEHAKNVISITGHPGVIAAKYAIPVPLTSKFDPNVVTEVAVDVEGRLIELESAEYKREREAYERKVKLEKDIMKEAEEETDPDNIEHFKRKCYLALQNRAKYQLHTREAYTAWQNYKKREMEVRDHYVRHPEHEKDWLPYLKEKLEERGEMNLFLSMEAAYHELRDELLGLANPDDDNNSTPKSESSPLMIKSETSSNSYQKEHSPLIIKSETSSNSPQKKHSPLMIKSEPVIKSQQDVSLPVITQTVEVFATISPFKDKVVSPTTKPDNIACECPGGVCLGLSTQPKQVLDSSSDEECLAGVCMGSQKVECKVEAVSNKDNDDIISVDSLHSVTEPLVNVKQPIGTDDDDIISADAVVVISEAPVLSVDPGFVEEPSVDIEDDVNPQNLMTLKRPSSKGKR